MNWLIIFTLVASMVSFFIVIGLCIADAFGFLQTRVQRKAVNKMFVISLVSLLGASAGFVTYSFRYLTFSAQPYLGFSESISSIQRVLYKENFLSDIPDGVLGPKTFSAVREFQKINGLKDTSGALDNETIEKLYAWKERPSSPINKENQDVMKVYMKKPSFKRLQEQVKWFQTVLIENGSLKTKAGTDGILRPGLQEAVSDFQSKKGIFNDGTINTDTWLYAIQDDINRLNIVKRLKDIK